MQEMCLVFADFYPRLPGSGGFMCMGLPTDWKKLFNGNFDEKYFLHLIG